MKDPILRQHTEIKKNSLLKAMFYYIIVKLIIYNLYPILLPFNIKNNVKIKDLKN